MTRRSALSAGGRAPVLLAAGAWAVLCLVLDAAGHAPSRAPVPSLTDGWYRIQAVLLVPVLLAVHAVLVLAAHRLAGVLGGAGPRAALWGPLGRVLGLSLLLLLVIPDAVAWALVGFDGLAGAMLWYAPLCLLAMLLGTTRTLQRAMGLGAGRALAAAWMALLAAGGFGSLFLR